MCTFQCGLLCAFFSAGLCVHFSVLASVCIFQSMQDFVCTFQCGPLCARFFSARLCVHGFFTAGLCVDGFSVWAFVCLHVLGGRGVAEDKDAVV